jgi:hypothetical protein
MHVFKYNNSLKTSVCDIVNEKLLEINNSRTTSLEIAVVYNDEDIVRLLAEAHAFKTGNITMCSLKDSYSAEWPVVFVILENAKRFSLGSKAIVLRHLYLAMSRARVKCYVFLYPVGGILEYRNIRNMEIFDDFEPFIRVIKH